MGCPSPPKSSLSGSDHERLFLHPVLRQPSVTATPSQTRAAILTPPPGRAFLPIRTTTPRGAPPTFVLDWHGQPRQAMTVRSEPLVTIGSDFTFGLGVALAGDCRPCVIALQSTVTPKRPARLDRRRELRREDTASHAPTRIVSLDRDRAHCVFQPGARAGSELDASNECRPVSADVSRDG